MIYVGIYFIKKENQKYGLTILYLLVVGIEFKQYLKIVHLIAEHRCCITDQLQNSYPNINYKTIYKTRPPIYVPVKTRHIYKLNLTNTKTKEQLRT